MSEADPQFPPFLSLYHEIDSQLWVCPKCKTNNLHWNLWYDCEYRALMEDPDYGAWCRECDGPTEPEVVE